MGKDTTFVGTDAAAAKLTKLKSRPGTAEQVAQIRAGMAAGDNPRVVVTVNGRDIELDLSTLAG